MTATDELLPHRDALKRVFQGAIEEIEKKGWYQQGCGSQGGACIVDGIYANADRPLVREHARKIVTDIVPDRYKHEFNWNDAPETTEEEVLGVLHFLSQDPYPFQGR